MLTSNFRSGFVDLDRLDRLASTCVTIGLGLEPGQDLVITSSVSALPLARLITRHAYTAGARLVTCFFNDEDMTLSRFLYAPDESFDHAAGWLYEGMAKAFDNGAARLAITGGDPMLLAHQDPRKVARACKANSIAYKPVLEKITRFDINWNIIAYPDTAWARLVFPGEEDNIATEKLAKAIFSASRIDGDDPVADWKNHNAALHKRAQWLDTHNFHSLRFTGPGTGLTIGLAEGHMWRGGATHSRNGVLCNPNIPTEEIFTTPHAQRVEGFVRSTKPLAYRGDLIDEIEMRFHDGAVTEVRAGKGERALKAMLDTDQGARRLGEVALVPHSSPVSAQELLFYNTLFDENAASHIALGQCYHECFNDTVSTNEEKIAECGGNKSLIHVDWMIGSDSIDVDGISEKGNHTPLMRKGEWVHQI